MSLTSQHLFVSPSRRSLYNLHFNRSSTPSLSIALRQHIPQHSHFQFLKYKPSRYDKVTSLRTHTEPFHLRVYESEGAVQKDVGDFSLLHLAELGCLLSSIIVSVGSAVNSLVEGSKKEFLVFTVGNKAMLWGILMLVGGVVIGAWIRRLQWRLICKETVKGGLEVNLLERIEKLEEDLRSSTIVVRALSRRLEKLGIEFRVTRKALKEPITETAALTHKNSEATRVLAVQSDILEKELGEIQKVLLAMQCQETLKSRIVDYCNRIIFFVLRDAEVKEQQQKQLDLIVAIGKSGKLWETRRETPVEGTVEMNDSTEDDVKQKEIQRL